MRHLVKINIWLCKIHNFLLIDFFVKSKKIYQSFLQNRKETLVVYHALTYLWRKVQKWDLYMAKFQKRGIFVESDIFGSNCCWDLDPGWSGIGLRVKRLVYFMEEVAVEQYNR